MDTRKKITILSPVYNEEQSLDRLYEEIFTLMNSDAYLGGRYDWELLLVNDGSRDGSLQKIRQLRSRDNHVNYVNLSRNFGKENALLAGFDYATGDCVIIMDSDLQDSTSVIPEMIGYWEDGYDDIYGKRRDRGRESWIRKNLTRVFYHILQRSTDIDVLPNVGDFRLLDRKCVDALKTLRETQRYTKGLFCWVGYSKKEVVFDRDDRLGGKSSYSIMKLINLGIEGIVSFTTTPLRFSTMMGFIVSTIAFVYMMVMVFKTLVWGEPVQGYPSMMCVVLFLGGCQLIAIGIIGEYIARIFNETKKRPVYVAESYNGENLCRFGLGGGGGGFEGVDAGVDGGDDAVGRRGLGG